MRNKTVAVVSGALVFGIVLMPSLLADKFADRVAESTEVFTALIEAPDQGVPQSLLEDCECVVVIPHVVKAALGIGGRHGNGLASCRNDQGVWSPPSFVKVSGGSIGFQIGVQASDLVLFMMTGKSAEALLNRQFTLGADASVAAGPLGRTVEADTDITLRAEILAYSRAKGLFAGVSLEGASLRPDETAIRRFYGERTDPEVILMEHRVPKLPDEAREFVELLP